MNRIFVDSSALIALAKTNDDRHADASNFLRSLTSAFQFLTTDYVLDETATRLRDSLGAEKAAYFVEKVLESKIYKVTYIDKRLFLASLKWLRKYADKPLSFTDCSSFAVMEKMNLKKAFTFDDDFRKVGFEMVPY